MRMGKYKVVGGKFVHEADLDKVSVAQQIAALIGFLISFAVGVWL